ncbi:hypothetical protein GEMRC1_005301 [Eukaryota sp. GEM-RC1]
MSVYNQFVEFRDRMFNEINQILNLLDVVKDEAHPLNKNAVTTLEQSITSSLESLQQMTQLQDITTLISATAHNLNSDLFNSMKNLVWDVSNITGSDSMFALKQVGSQEKTLTNSTYDLAVRSPSNQLQLAYHVVMGRDYVQSTERFQKLFLDNPMKQLITVTVGDIHDLQGGIHLVLVNVSLVVASTMVIVLFIYVLLILTPTEKLASHVQQVIRLSMMERYYNQSLRALSCLGVIIAIFFAYTLFSSLMIRTWPQQLQLAGQRASTVYEVGADVFSAFIYPESRDEHCFRLQNNVNKLFEIHSSLQYRSSSNFLGPAAGRYANQNNLVYETNFNNFLFNASSNEESGLDYLLHRYVSLVTPIMHQENDLVWDVQSSLVEDILETGYKLANLCLDSIDVFHAELITTISLYRTLMILLTLFVFCITLLIYFALFRKMLRTLVEEEDINMQLISMIPNSVVASCKVIRNFVRNY